MTDSYLRFFQRWVGISVGMLVAAFLVPGIHYRTPGALLLAAMVLGCLNAVVRPVLVVLTLPLVVVTLSLFYFVINALLLWLVGWLGRDFGFSVAGFWPALFGGLVISIVASLINLLIGSRTRVEVRKGGKRSRERSSNNGRVIDV